jgi:hypothetical protein
MAAKKKKSGGVLRTKSGGFRKMTSAEVKMFDKLMMQAVKEGRARTFGPGSKDSKKKPAKKKSSGKLTAAQRKKMAPGQFVFPNGTKADPGKKKFPIHNVQHARSALSRASNKQVKLTGPERCKVMRAVCKKFPKVGMCADPARKKQSKLLKSC